MDKASIDQEYAASPEFYKDIIDSVSVGGIFVDKTRTIRHCNAYVNRIFGYKKAELLGKRTDILYGDRRKDPSDKNEIYDHLEKNGYHIGSALGTKKDGGSVPLTLYTFIIKENSGAFIFIKEAELKKEEIARNAEKLLQDLLDNIPDMIYFKDMENRFILVNRAHAEALGLTPREVIGKSDLDLFPKELAEKYFEDDNEILSTGKAVIGKITSAKRPDGGTTYVSTTKAPRFDENLKVIGTIGITRNITDKMIAEEELRLHKDRLEELVNERTKELEEEKQKLLRMYNIKSDFTAMVSHELRTPISTIKEGVGIVADGTAGGLNSDQRNFLDRAMESIDRLSRLINDVLDFSKLENKKVEFNIVEGNLNGLIDQVVKSYAPVVEKKGLKLTAKLDPFLPLVRFDPDRISQVLYNLISNAIKFTEKGSITVETKKEDSAVVTTIQDTGIGIKKEDLYRIFEKFEQISSEESGKTEGAGLGLAICKQIVEQLGGRIWVESKYGKGSKFIFTLPV